MSKVAVIIVTYNGINWIKKCLESVFDSTLKCDVFVIDNASTDKTLAVVKAFEKVQIIENQINVGFGKANNVAIKESMKVDYDFFFLLNQDTWIDKNCIEILVQTLTLDPEFGVLSPMHFAANETDLDSNFEKYLKDGYNINGNLVVVPFVNAAAWLVSRKCFEKIGLFEPVFAHYGEDRNFCNRAKYHRFKIGIACHAKIVHDRLIVRSFKKDIVQSEYLILNTLININLKSFDRYFIALMQVVGLPKYFFKWYGVKKAFFLWCQLISFYLKNIFEMPALNKVIKISRAGQNGF